jgi:UDP-2-acetamido-3-amino-2,3-dideoxy-glucuronate N-acetyltransferase
MIAHDVELAEGVVIFHPDLVNLYGCRIGPATRVGTFVEIQKGAVIGARCKVSSHTFVCEGVTMEDGVFVGHGVMFINDTYPRALTDEGALQSDADWQVVPTLVKTGASIGSNATILGGVTIGVRALVGAGAVVTRDVPDHAIVAGVPARVVGDVRER